MIEQVVHRALSGVRWLRREVLVRSFVRHVGALTVANGLNATLSFIQGILVARWLGPELYGVAALVMSVPSLIYTFFDARSAEASVKFLSEFDARGEREQALAMCKLGYAVDFAIAGIALLVVLLLAPWAAKSIVHRPEMKWLIILYGSASLPQALVGTSYAVLATLGRFPSIALIDTLTNLMRVGLVLGLVGLGWQVAGVVWGNMIAMAARGLIYGAWAYGLVKRRWKCSWLSGHWRYLKGRRREVLAFLAYNDLGALLGMIPKQLDVVILGYFRNPAEVGYYKLAKSLAGVAGYIVGPLQSVVYPEFAKLWGIGDANALWQKIRKLTLQVGLPLGLAMLCSITLLPFILPALVGQAYRPAVFATQLLLVGSATWLGFFWLKPVYFAQGRLRMWVQISTIVVFLTIAGFVIIVPYWGYVGMSLWWMLMSGLGHLLALGLLRVGVT